MIILKFLLANNTCRPDAGSVRRTWCPFSHPVRFPWVAKPAGAPRLVTMTIQEQVDHDLREAMRAKDADRLSTLRMAKAALMNSAIEKHGAGSKLPDPDAIVVLRKQVK